MKQICDDNLDNYKWGDSYEKNKYFCEKQWVDLLFLLKA